MTDYTWSDDLAPFAQSFWLQPHVGRSESPFTRQQKIYGLSAPRWVTRLDIRGGYAGRGLRGKGAAVDGFLAKLEGGIHRAMIYDFRRPWPSVGYDLLAFDDETGFDDGTGFLDNQRTGSNLAAAAGATTMDLEGCAPSSLLMLAGDYLGGDGRPHIATADVWSDIGGRASVDFRPPLSTAVAAGNATFYKVRGRFRLVSDDAGNNPASVDDLQQMSIDLIEDL
jgi:hypothetical protein